MISGICEYCHNEFQYKPRTSTHVQRHCTKACLRVAREATRTHVCVQCGEIYTTKQHKKDSQYCSLRCSSTAQQVRETRHCKHCGEPFDVQPSDDNQYCKRACYSAAQVGKPRPNMVGRTPWSAGKTADTDERMAAIAKKLLKNVVDRDTLDDLYVTQNLPLRDIGERYGVSKSVIKRLVGEFGLERVPRESDSLTEETLRVLYASGTTFAAIGKQFNCSGPYVNQLASQWGIASRRNNNRANIDVDPEELRRLYWDKWLGYEAIAAHFGVDMTTIPYWLKKFDISRRTNGETRRGPDWQEPQESDIATICFLYETGMGAASIAGVFPGTDRSYIIRLLRAQGVVIRASGYQNRQQLIAQDGHRVKSGLELQVDNWLFEHKIEHTYEPGIPSTKFRADFFAAGRYVEIWGLMGNERYKRQRQKKLQAYERLRLPLLSIYPKDFPHLGILDLLIS